MAKYGINKYGLVKYGLYGDSFKVKWNFKNAKSHANQNYPLTRVEILDKEDIPIKLVPDKDVISFDTTFTAQNGIRKTATLTLVNENNKYTPQYRGIWIQTKFKLYSGKVVNGVEQLYSRGVYCITGVQINDSASIPTITFALSDKYVLLDGSLAGTLPIDMIINRDTPVSTAIRNVLAQSSDKKSPLITNTNVNTFYDLIIETGKSFDDLIKPLADMVAYQYGYDSNGIFVFNPTVVNQTMEYSNNPSVYDFEQDDVNFIESSTQQDFTKIKNSIVVIGENILDTLIRSEISDNYIFSTTRKELIEERVKVVSDRNIYSQELADTRAAYELFVSIRLQEQVDITCNVIDFIKENDIVTIQNRFTGAPERYLVNSVNYSSTSSTMGMSIWKIRDTI